MEDKLLAMPLARRLYEEGAKDLPIIDFHNHLSVADLARDRQFRDLGELWVESDPYKHRAMRILGVDEALITGGAEPFEKFRAWCTVFPELVGNPLTPWSEMELRGVLGIDLPICRENAGRIWEEAGERLKEKGFSARGILGKFPVRYHAPCASFTDDLSVFEGVDNAAPSLRGDSFSGDIPGICRDLEQRYGERIEDLETFTALVSRRLGEFHAAGCRFSDHALDAGWMYLPSDGTENDRFTRLLAGQALTPEEKARLDCHILRLLAGEYEKRNWVLQLHIGAARYTSSRLRRVAGPAGGFAGIGHTPVEDITRLLDDLESAGTLPRVILYSMESASWPLLAILTGSFNRSGQRGYVQLGPAWWWCDHMGGMREVLGTVMRYGSLASFVGMTTDSRSLLSFSRHDYFRRVLCGWLGELAAAGEITSDLDSLCHLVRLMSYENANTVLKERNV